MVGQLVERIRQKDQRAMSQLYRHYVKELSSVCYRYVSDKDDVKDVLQNSFVKIFTTLPTIDYRGEEALWSWMRKVVVYESLNYLRERKKLKLVAIASDQLHRLISELPNGYRTVVNLYIFEGYSHRQIAELLSIKESTSASQLYFAKRLLAKRINELLNGKR